jgi:hypothetical protein
MQITGLFPPGPGPRTRDDVAVADVQAMATVRAPPSWPRPVATSPTLAITGRDTVFRGRFTTDPWHPDDDVAPDDNSFVMLRPVEEHRELVMVVNWIEELRRRTAGRSK